MRFGIVSDVHGAHGALRRVAPEGSTLLVLGDLVNMVDYRTLEGIVPDVVGVDLVAEVVALRGEKRFEDASARWAERSAGRIDDIRAQVATRMAEQYARVGESLAHYTSYVTFGNVDNVDLLKASLPVSATFVDAGVYEIAGFRIGFAGGGIPSIGSAGEVSHEDMEAKLGRLGPVDILCTHVPPAIPMLASDVVGGYPKGSQPVLDYLLEHRPIHHFFGDVHQPRALSWQLGPTTCRNVGYFRATGRGFEFA